MEAHEFFKRVDQHRHELQLLFCSFFHSLDGPLIAEAREHLIQVLSQLGVALGNQSLELHAWCHLQSMDATSICRTLPLQA